MIGESGLAGVNRRFEVQKAAAQLGAYAAMALVAVLGVRRCWTVSYSRNRAYVDDGRRRRRRGSTRCRRCARGRVARRALLPRLDAVRGGGRFGQPP